MVNDEVVAKLVAMGFTSTQVREAGVALPGASQYQIVDYLLGIGSGAAVQSLNDKNSVVRRSMLDLDSLHCPLTMEVMRDPVLAADGQTYERAEIEKWFANGNRMSPLTGAELPSTLLTPNIALRKAIAAIRETAACQSSGPTEKANAEVRLRDMGFTTAQIQLAHDAVGSLSNVAALTEWLLRSGQEPLGQELVAAGGVRDLRAELVRKLKHHSLCEVQVDNALDAVGGVTDSSEASIEMLRKWIFENMELSNRPSTRLIRSKLLDLGLSAEEATRKADAARQEKPLFFFLEEAASRVHDCLFKSTCRICP
jgi:hypothetical protein